MKKYLNGALMLILLIPMIFMSGCNKESPIFDTDRCLKMNNTHCEVVRIPGGTVNVTVNSTNQTYYYNYTYY